MRQTEGCRGAKQDGRQRGLEGCSWFCPASPGWASLAGPRTGLGVLQQDSGTGVARSLGAPAPVLLYFLDSRKAPNRGVPILQLCQPFRWRQGKPPTWLAGASGSVRPSGAGGWQVGRPQSLTGQWGDAAKDRVVERSHTGRPGLFGDKQTVAVATLGSGPSQSESFLLTVLVMQVQVGPGGW